MVTVATGGTRREVVFYIRKTRNDPESFRFVVHRPLISHRFRITDPRRASRFSIYFFTGNDSIGAGRAPFSETIATDSSDTRKFPTGLRSYVKFRKRSPSPPVREQSFENKLKKPSDRTASNCYLHERDA